MNELCAMMIQFMDIEASTECHNQYYIADTNISFFYTWK